MPEQAPIPHPAQTSTLASCEIHNRPLELICYTHRIRICTSCALFGEHKPCEIKPEDEVIKEITLRTELLIEIYELVEGTKSNYNDHTEIENLYENYKKRKVTLRQKVQDTFKSLVNELKRKEERTLDILESNYNKVEQYFNDVRDTNSGIFQETEVWLNNTQEKMDIFNSSTDPNYVAFEMLEDPNPSNDIVRVGEGLLERLHQQLEGQSPEVKEAVVGLTNLLEQLKIEFDDHFKNRITMLCHVPKLSLENNGRGASPGPNNEKADESPIHQESHDNLMDDDTGLMEADLGALHEADYSASLSYVEDQITLDADIINLEGRELKDDFVSMMLDLLSERPAVSVECIDLSSNHFTDLAALPICDMVSMGTEGPFGSVSSINFGQNQLTEQSVEAFLQMAQACPQLQTVNLAGNPITSSPLIQENNERGVFQW